MNETAGMGNEETPSVMPSKQHARFRLFTGAAVPSDATAVAGSERKPQTDGRREAQAARETSTLPRETAVTGCKTTLPTSRKGYE